MPAKKTKKSAKVKKSSKAAKVKKSSKAAKAKKSSTPSKTQKVAKAAKAKKVKKSAKSARAKKAKVTKVKKSSKAAKAKKAKKASKATAAKKSTSSATRAPLPAKEVSSHSLDTEGRNELPESKFAFPAERKEPLDDATHVRNAIARFDQVTDVSDDERDRAWERIKEAAKEFDVDISEDDWRDLFKEATKSD
ncbi:MAG: hypothetical protein JWM55_475 [Acidimicrobiaceae bacterium]|nr:hypothetical protein [Acidimicrobiaceae bacterium]